MCLQGVVVDASKHSTVQILLQGGHRPALCCGGFCLISIAFLDAVFL
jgi:hypothetical protein